MKNKKTYIVLVCYIAMMSFFACGDEKKDVEAKRPGIQIFKNLDLL